MKPRTFFWLLRRAAVNSFNDNCIGTAKSAAYSSVLSFFPGLMVVASLFLSQRAAVVVVDELSIALGRVLPPEAYRAAANFLTKRQGLLAGAWIVAIWSASGVMVSLMDGFRAAYRIPTARSILRSRLMALALLPIAGAPMLLATLLLFFGQQIESWLLAHLGAASWVTMGGRILRWSVSLATSVLVIGLVYHVAPNRRQNWRFVWPGAVLATALWLAATLLFAWYVQHVARYSDLYGSISTAVVLLIWMFLVNLIVMVGCEFNAEYERQHPGGITDEHR